MAAGSLTACLVIGAAIYFPRGSGSMANANQATVPKRTPGVHVEVVHPSKGTMERTTTQPGSVQAYESVHLYAGVSGYLKSQAVDIGDRIQRGQTLAIVDVPELLKQIQQHQSGVERARAQVCCK